MTDFLSNFLPYMVLAVFFLGAVAFLLSGPKPRTVLWASTALAIAFVVSLAYMFDAGFRGMVHSTFSTALNLN
jgi:uncharacterized membrane protein